MTSQKRPSERGSITLESVIVWPTIILAIFAIIQGGLWAHARNVALGAAQEGARVASTETRGDGSARAADFISDTGGDRVITIKSISQSAGANTVTITVAGHAPSVIPGIPGPAVTQSSTAPLKEWTTP